MAGYDTASSGIGINRNHSERIAKHLLREALFTTRLLELILHKHCWNQHFLSIFIDTVDVARFCFATKHHLRCRHSKETRVAQDLRIEGRSQQLSLIVIKFAHIKYGATTTKLCGHTFLIGNQSKLRK